MSVGGNTVVGGGVVVHGRVHGAQDITIHGRVDGRVELAATLVVGTNAVLKADLQVKRVIVFGVVVGTIHAEEAVDLRAGARVVGDVYAPHLLMEDGALFKGNVSTPDMAPRIPRPASQPPVAPRAPSAPPPSGRPQPRVMPRQDVQPVELAPSLPPGESAVPPRGRTAPPPAPAPAAEPRPAAPTRKRVGVVRGRSTVETAPPPARPLSAPPSPEDAPPAPRPLPGRGSGARVQVKRR